MTTAEQTVTDVEIEAIVTGLNNRTVFKDASIAELAASIKEHGLIQPVTVRPLKRPRQGKKYQLVAGERRMRAVLTLGWATIPAIVRELTDQQARAITLIENTHREDVDPIDEAGGYKAYMDEFGVDELGVAQAANVDVRRVFKRLELLKLIPKIQDRVRKEPQLLSLFELMTVLDPERQEFALQVLTKKSKPPTIAEFRRVVNDFKTEQDREDGTQGALFTAEQMAAMWVEKFETAEALGGKVRRAVLPVDARFPVPDLKDRRQWLANQLKKWADQLAAAGFEEGAAAVYAAVEYSIRQNRLEADESQWPEFFF